MVRLGRAMVGLLVIGLLVVAANAYAEREGSGYTQDAGDMKSSSVEIKGTISGNQLKVTSGPYAGKTFTLVENPVAAAQHSHEKSGGYREGS